MSVTLGVVIGNRGFFPSHLCETGRQAILDTLSRLGIRAIIPDPEATSFAGAVETLGDAQVCADLFKQHRDEIDGILVTLPNFGDEKAVANTLRWAGLGVPVLVHAFADDPNQMAITHRRDSFCGKMSVCNNLSQYGIPYSLTQLHAVDPATPAFEADLTRFGQICHVVRGMRGARIGMIGARPAAFNTVRFSEKILEAAHISVETVDLSEILGQAKRMGDDDPAVKEKLEAIHAYTSAEAVPAEAVMRIAKLGAVIDRWSKDNALDATAIQCWTAMEEFYGVAPCTIMSMASSNLYSSACETDVGGVLGMHALACASGKPSALLDWNNNYGDSPDKGIMFHCSNLPRDFFVEQTMDYQQIVAGDVGKENAYGTIVGRIRPSPFTLCRVSTDDSRGCMRGYVGEGRFTEDTLETFGGYGVFEIRNLQGLLHYICRNGFEHHLAANLSQTADVIHEALSHYLGWDMHWHKG
ncbi:MAG: L-fucose/L-arabinose isomerase family protein [Candidatus Hydrogenedentota bacterium]